MRQKEVFQLAERDYDLTTSRLANLSGFHRNTISGWRNGSSLMELPSFVTMLRHLPDELSSMLTEPAGKHIATDEPSEGDLDTLGREAAGFVADKLEREADGNICHIDKAALKSKARRIASTARSAAA